MPLKRGWEEISKTFRWLASRWSMRLDLVAAGVSGDSVGGVPVEPYTQRVTRIVRREQGEWKIANRHADYVPIDQTLRGEASTK